MRLSRLRQGLPRVLLFTRYLLPVLTGVTLLVLSFFYNVYYYQLGSRYVLSLFHFYFDTFSALKEYFAGGSVGNGALYAWLTAGALFGVLCLILALTLAVFAFLPVLRTFFGSPAAKEKLRFKILFPNRVCLFLSCCLYLPTTLYPQYFARVFRRVGGSRDLIFIETNLPLIVTAVLTVLTLALAVYARFAEKREPRYDPFLPGVALPQPDEAEPDEP